MGNPTMAFRRVFLLVSLFYIFIAPVTCNENRRICVTVQVTPETCRKLTSNLEWGKWIKGFYDFQEVDPPTATSNPFKFCSSGRQMSTSGTTGSVTLKRCDSSNGFTIKWNNPWAGESYQTEEFDENSFAMKKTKISDWQWRYEVTMK